VNATFINQSNGAVSYFFLFLISDYTQVDPRFPILAQWKSHYDIEKLLVEIRKELASPVNRKAPQPPEGATFQ